MVAEEKPKRKRSSPKNYDALKRKFMVWLVTPDEDRTPGTQKAFAEENGVFVTTLSEWRHQPAFVAKLNELVDKHLADEFSEATRSLKREAAKGTFNHLKLYLEMLGKYVPKIAPTTPDGKNPYDNAPTADLFREIDRILDKGRSRATRGDNS